MALLKLELKNPPDIELDLVWFWHFVEDNVQQLAIVNFLWKNIHSSVRLNDIQFEDDFID